MGVSRDCPNFMATPIISGTGIATDFKFCSNIHRIDRNMKNVGNSGRGRSQGVPKIFKALMYRAHCAVIFAIAQLSCLLLVDVKKLNTHSISPNYRSGRLNFNLRFF